MWTQERDVEAVQEALSTLPGVPRCGEAADMLGHSSIDTARSTPDTWNAWVLAVGQV